MSYFTNIANFLIYDKDYIYILNESGFFVTNEPCRLYISDAEKLNSSEHMTLAAILRIFILFNKNLILY